MKDLKCFGILYKKEIFSYLINPAFYIAACIFCATAATNFFILQNFFIEGKGSSDMRYFFSYFPYIAIIVFPVLSMGLWTEETGGLKYKNENNSIPVSEMIPVSSECLVFSKWAASLTSFIFILVGTISVPITVSKYGHIDLNLVLTAYLLVVCYGGALLSIGLFFSLVTPNQTAAFILTAMILAVFNSIHLLPVYVSLPAFFSSLFKMLSFAWHFDAAGKGIIDTCDILFFAAITFVFLSSSVFCLERRKMI